MKKIIIATIIGGIIIHAFTFISWMVLPFHTQTMNYVENEDEMRIALKQFLKDDGLYVVPGFPPDMPQSEAMEAMSVKHGEGPIASIFYTGGGGVPMSPQLIFTGLILNLLSALCTAFVLSFAAGKLPKYIHRVGIVSVMGILLAIQSDLAYWCWMWFPLDHTLAQVFDDIIGWTLVGLAQAWIIKE